jgi:phosphogluconate dehydratase
LIIDWDDFSALSDVVPLLTRVYPNGSADVNQFQAAGGPGYVIRELLDAGLMHADVLTVRADGIRAFTQKPVDVDGHLAWEDIGASKDLNVVRPATSPFSVTGGLRLLQGNLGRSVIKVSAVPETSHVIEAPAQVFNSQEELLNTFQAGALNKDVVCVVRWQGPQANGMPELHRLTPPLSVLQDKGFKVALVTDGRMSGASGKVPAAIHLSPESVNGGLIGKVQTGDMITLDCDTQTLTLEVSDAELAARTAPTPDLSGNQHGTGRDIFALFRAHASLAEEGASPLFNHL